MKDERSKENAGTLQKFPRIRSKQGWKWNPFTDGETNTEPSETVQNEAYTIEEILERFTRGTWKVDHHEGIDAGAPEDDQLEEEIDLEKFSKLDPAERHEVIMDMKGQVHNYLERKKAEAEQKAHFEKLDRIRKAKIRGLKVELEPTDRPLVKKPKKQ